MLEKVEVRKFDEKEMLITDIVYKKEKIDAIQWHKNKISYESFQS